MVILTKEGTVVRTLPITLVPGPLDKEASTIQGGSVATAGTSAGFILQLRDSFGNKEDGSFDIVPDVAVLDSSGASVTAAVLSSYTGQGQFKIQTTVTVAAAYALQIQLGGVSVKGSPLSFAVGPAAKNAQASLVQLDQSLVAGVKAAIRVHAFDR